MSNESCQIVPKTEEVPVRKGWLQSTAIKYIIMIVVTPMVTTFINNLPAVEQKLVDILPLWVDPAIHPLITGIGMALSALFGLGAARGVKKEAAGAPTEIRGLIVPKK